MTNDIVRYWLTRLFQVAYFDSRNTSAERGKVATLTIVKCNQMKVGTV